MPVTRSSSSSSSSFSGSDDAHTTSTSPSTIVGMSSSNSSVIRSTTNPSIKAWTSSEIENVSDSECLMDLDAAQQSDESAGYQTSSSDDESTFELDMDEVNSDITRRCADCDPNGMHHRKTRRGNYAYKCPFSGSGYENPQERAGDSRAILEDAGIVTTDTTLNVSPEMTQVAIVMTAAAALGAKPKPPCANCGNNKRPRPYRNPFGHGNICTTCNMYIKRKGEPRPIEYELNLRKCEQRKLDETGTPQETADPSFKWCSHHKEECWATAWYRDTETNEHVCGPCWKFFKATGERRPLGYQDRLEQERKINPEMMAGRHSKLICAAKNCNRDITDTATYRTEISRRYICASCYNRHRRIYNERKAAGLSTENIPYVKPVKPVKVQYPTFCKSEGCGRTTSCKWHKNGTLCDRCYNRQRIANGYRRPR